jgi:hypothetical protein
VSVLVPVEGRKRLNYIEQDGKADNRKTRRQQRKVQLLLSFVVIFERIRNQQVIGSNPTGDSMPGYQVLIDRAQVHDRPMAK